jgi:hypothetical protein
MARMPPEFLKSPPDIRQAVGWLAQRAKRMDLAVAFVGRDWRDAVADFRGRMRVVCWLSSTNTDPRAVRQLIASRRTDVRQRDGMHAKVYIAPGVGAIVDSANLSSQALAEIDQSGRDEAAVFVSGTERLTGIISWFTALWRADGTRRITRRDLVRALIAFRKAHKSARGSRRRGGKRQRGRAVESLPPRSRARLIGLARRVRGEDLSTLIKHRMLPNTPPERITRLQLESVVDQFEEWMGRRFLFERAFLERSISRTREALAILFNEALDVSARLKRVIGSGAVAPLGMSTLSVLLYWRAPESYPPFNRRTKRFLRDFGLGERGASNASPTAYMRWLDQAQRLSQELELPTRGHIDRVAWEYTKRMKILRPLSTPREE